MFSNKSHSTRGHATFAAAGLLLAGLAATALGADAPAPPAAAAPMQGCRHGEIDVAKMNARAAEVFAAADSNADGKITEVEFLEFKPPHGGPGGHMDGPGMMGGPGMGMGGPGMMMGPAMAMSGGMGHHGMGGGPDGAPMSPEAREAQMQAFQTEVFTALDTDHNGQLSPAEFARQREVVRTMIAKRMFVKLDKNGDGVLTKEEFPPFAQKVDALDTNDDGKVTPDEMKAARAAKGGQTGKTTN